MKTCKDAKADKVTLDTPMAESPEISREAISAMRRSYGEAGITESSINPDPIAQFSLWLKEAAANSMIVEANAMVLSTLGQDGPSSRTVLLKDVDKSGFTFFTNYQSDKARQIQLNPKVCLLFPWYPMERQVSVVGRAIKIDRKVSEQYFATRPWSSQIGAIASSQSEVIDSRLVLEERFKELAEKYPEGSDVPMPENWGGYLVEPSSIEFWQGRYSRLHDRLRFNLSGSNWSLERLSP
jgi:pyridoxamine 5'-phosphate oxidase